MKKLMSVLFCFLLPLIFLMGCSKEEIQTPGINDLPFEEHAGFWVLNVTQDSKTPSGDDSSYSSMTAINIDSRELKSLRECSLFGETVKLNYISSDFLPLGDFKSAIYTVSGKKSGNYQTHVRITEKGEISTLLAYPFAEHSFPKEMTDDEVYSLARSLLSEQFDFDKYTDFSCLRAQYGEPSILIFSRSYGGYRCSDFLEVNIIGNTIFSINCHPSLDIPASLKTPSAEELNAVIQSYLDDYCKDTWRIVKEYAVTKADITRFDGKFVLHFSFDIEFEEVEGQNDFYDEISLLMILE